MQSFSVKSQIVAGVEAKRHNPDAVSSTKGTSQPMHNSVPFTSQSSPVAGLPFTQIQTFDTNEGASVVVVPAQLSTSDDA